LKKDFRLSIGFNIATLSNNVTKLANGVTEVVGITGTKWCKRKANILIGSSIASIYSNRNRQSDNGQRMFWITQREGSV
jgi:hypothetical protein